MKLRFIYPEPGMPARDARGCPPSPGDMVEGRTVRARRFEFEAEDYLAVIFLSHPRRESEGSGQ